MAKYSLSKEYGRRCNLCHHNKRARQYYKPIKGEWLRVCDDCWTELELHIEEDNRDGNEAQEFVNEKVEPHHETMPLIEALRATFCHCHVRVCSGKDDGVCLDKEVGECNRRLALSLRYIGDHDQQVRIKAYQEGFDKGKLSLSEDYTTQVQQVRKDFAEECIKQRPSRIGCNDTAKYVEDDWCKFLRAMAEEGR